MPNLNELLAGIAELNPDPKDFATGLQSTFQPGFQEVFERGHKTKTADAKKEVAVLKAQLSEKETEIADLTEKAEAAGKGTVEVEKIREQHKKDVADLKAKHAAEITTRDDRLKKGIVDNAVKLTQAALEGAGLFPIHAEAQAEKIRAFVRPNLETNSFEILKEAGSDVAIQPADGKAETALRVRVDEMRKSLPKEMYMSGKVGKGASDKIEDGASGGGGDGNVYDRIRNRRTAEKEAGEKGKAGSGALFERMGVAKPA